jgi:single-stranded DNA-binding protein
MSTTNFGTIVGTIVSEITSKNPLDNLKVVEFRIKPIGASDEDSPLPMTAYNGVGGNILKRYNQGDTIALTHRLRYKTWNTAEGEPRGRYEVNVTSTQTIRLGKISSAKRQEEMEKKQQAPAEVAF